MLTSAKYFRKIEAIERRALRFMTNNYENTYEDLLNKTGKPNMDLRRTRSVRPRVTNRVLREKYKVNLEIPKSIQVTFSTRSLRIQAANE